jgi:hypothetical protein
MGDLPKNRKRKSGRVVMGDLPKWRDGRVVMGDLPRKKLVRAERRTRKEVGLENALPKRWWLKGALGRR